MLPSQSRAARGDQVARARACIRLAPGIRSLFRRAAFLGPSCSWAGAGFDSVALCLHLQWTLRWKLSTRHVIVELLLEVVQVDRRRSERGFDQAPGSPPVHLRVTSLLAFYKRLLSGFALRPRPLEHSGAVKGGGARTVHATSPRRLSASTLSLPAAYRNQCAMAWFCVEGSSFTEAEYGLVRVSLRSGAPVARKQPSFAKPRVAASEAEAGICVTRRQGRLRENVSNLPWRCLQVRVNREARARLDC